MRLSRQGGIETLGYEAIVQTRYIDGTGTWTIAGGHTAAAGDPDPRTYTGIMSIADCVDLFFRDAARYAATVAKLVTRAITQQQFDALVDFHYNTGKIARIAPIVNAGGDVGAALAQYTRSKGQVLDALVKRRSGERHLYETGEYVNGGHVTLLQATPQGRVIWKSAKRIIVT